MKTFINPKEVRKKGNSIIEEWTHPDIIIVCTPKLPYC